MAKKYTILLLLQFVTVGFSLNIAFLGDTGADDEAKRNLEQMKSHDVSLIVHNGDLDYTDSPARWSDFIERYWMSETRSILVTSGNHELYSYSRIRGLQYSQMWGGNKQSREPGYQSRMYKLLQRPNNLELNRNCEGIETGKPVSLRDYGEIMSCDIYDPTALKSKSSRDPLVFLFMMGWEQLRDKRQRQLAILLLKERMSNSNSVWKVCSWHEPEAVVNPGVAYGGEYKGDILQILEICRQHGAIIMNGHSHVYARTKLVKQFTPDSLMISSKHDDDIVELQCGETIALVNGIGGGSVYPFKPDGAGSRSEHANEFVVTVARDNMRTYPITDVGGAAICNFSAEKAQCQVILNGKSTSESAFDSAVQLDKFEITPPARNCAVHPNHQESLNVNTTNSEPNSSFVRFVAWMIIIFVIAYYVSHVTSKEKV